MTTPNTNPTKTGVGGVTSSNVPPVTGTSLSAAGVVVGSVDGSTNSTKKSTSTTGATTAKKKKARPKKKKTSPQNQIQNQQQLPSPLTQMKSMMEYQNAQNELYQIQQRQYDISMDPLWTNSNGSTAPKPTTTTTNNSTKSSSNNGVLTQDEEILQSCLQRVGLVREGTSSETKKDVIGHGAYEVILEYARKYALELLQDAQEYAQHCNGSASTNSKVTSRDIELASQFLQDENEEDDHYGYSTDMNRIPLPLLPNNCYTGIVLPDDNHNTTLARTYDVVSAARISQQFSLSSSSSQTPKTNTNNHNNNNNNDTISSNIKSSSTTTPSYGATRKRQIPINFKKTNTIDDNQTTTSASPTTTSTTTPTLTMNTSATTTTTSSTKRKADELDLISSDI